LRPPTVKPVQRPKVRASVHGYRLEAEEQPNLGKGRRHRRGVEEEQVPVRSAKLPAGRVRAVGTIDQTEIHDLDPRGARRQATTPT
jgi:hypothetical protein